MGSGEGAAVTISEVRSKQQLRPGHAVEEPLIALVRNDVYAVMSSHETMGFVERVGNVYVALDGPDIARACEVGQSLSWDEAVLMVRRSFTR